MLTHYCAPSALTIARISGSVRRSSTAAASPAVAAAAKSDAEAEEEELLGHTEGISRDKLVGRPLWDNYSAKVKRRMEAPTHRGVITPEEAKALNCDLVVVEHGAEACGDAVRLFWAVERGSKVIRKARFQTFGCATAIAASDATAELCEGKTVAQARALVSSKAVEKHLRDTADTPAVPPQKMHCSVMASEVVRKAALLADGSSASTPAGAPCKEPGPRDDDYVVCDCGSVTLGEVRRAIREHGLRTVAAVTEHTKAGGFCGACVRPGGHEARRAYLIDIVRDELLRARAEEALQSGVADSLASHSGSCAVVDAAAPAGDAPARISVRFAGACGGCMHSGGATLAYVQDVLRRGLRDPKLEVVRAD